MHKGSKILGLIFLAHRVVEGRDNEMLEGNPSFHMTTGHIKACQVHLE